MAGKGDRYRPVDGEVFRDNYEAIYGSKRTTTKMVKCQRCSGAGTVAKAGVMYGEEGRVPCPAKCDGGLIQEKT